MDSPGDLLDNGFILFSPARQQARRVDSDGHPIATTIVVFINGRYRKPIYRL